MQQILLVEDSIDCQEVIRKSLLGVEANLVVAETLKEARRIFKEHTRSYFDLILLDCSLPDGDGLSLFEGTDINSFSQETPVFLITSCDESSSMIQAFDAGVEDYILKPVDPVKLCARVRARLRKAQLFKRNSNFIRKAELSINVPLVRAQILSDGKALDLELTTKEFKLLCFLARHENKVFTRQEIVREIWGTNIHVLARTVDSHISSLRRKLGKISKYVESVPGTGYRFSLNTVEAAIASERCLA